ncbi:hypothetical protein AAMO2058_001034200 [Amorphochlora amoebiformis]
MVFLISKHQAPSLASWRPALWIPGIRDFHRAQVQWRLGCDHQTLMEVIPAVLRAGGFIVYSQDSGKITAGHLSNELQFLHHVTIRIARQQPSSVVLEVTCGSAAVCPAWVPLVLLFSIPLCWIPFPDCGENERLLEKIKRLLLVQGAKMNYGILMLDERHTVVLILTF